MNNRVQQLSGFYQSYCKRVGKVKLSEEEFQPLVLNAAYLEIAKAKKNDTDYDVRYIFDEFEKAAIEVDPDYLRVVKDPRYTTLFFGFSATAEWDGLWNFLKEFFESKVGIKIDDDARIALRFDSTAHERYENNQLVSRSEVSRKIHVNISEDMKNAQFSISETLSPKEAFLVSQHNDKYVYLGNDPDFRFEFDLDDFGNIINFTLFRTDRNLHIQYFE